MTEAQTQFSILVAAVVLSAVVPTAVAQRRFHPAVVSVEGSERLHPVDPPEEEAG